ncbi:MAG: hypothetical protein CM1200mP22_33270 [Dehalococcoidia bacterium]|nr:MAG: hypothetical protein CM1200mP22_33270 [Dehalococcoidia bacterium]
MTTGQGDVAIVGVAESDHGHCSQQIISAAPFRGCS